MSTPANSIPDSIYAAYYPPRTALEAAFRAVRRAKVPQVPNIVLSLREELRQPEPDLMRAADLVEQDLAMTGQVLKAINSPFMANRAKISSVRRAVGLIGLRRLTNLVTAVTFSRLMVGERKGGARQIFGFTQEQARVSAAVAALAHEVTADEAYLFGMMQNVGNLIFADLIKGYENEWTLYALANPQNLMNSERRALSTDHPTVGFLMAGTWHLPEAVVLAIYYQNTLEVPAAFDLHLRSLMAVSKLTRLLLALRRGIEDTPALLDQRDWGLQELDISLDEWERFVAHHLANDEHNAE